MVALSPSMSAEATTTGHDYYGKSGRERAKPRSPLLTGKRRDRILYDLSLSEIALLPGDFGGFVLELQRRKRRDVTLAVLGPEMLWLADVEGERRTL